MRYWAAGLSLGAALIHSVLVEEHLAEWWGYGLFFLLAALAQGFYGVLLLAQPWQPSRYGGGALDAGRLQRGILLAGILGNLSIVALYVVTRTVGIPFFGPEAGEVEPWTGLGLVSKAAELALVYCLWRLFRTARADVRAPPNPASSGPTSR